MLAKYEKRLANFGESIWIARWLNLENSPHWHNEIEIVFCETGVVCVELESEKIILEKQECVLLSGGVAHKITAKNDAVCITALISDAIAPDITAKYYLCEKKLSTSYDIPDFYRKIKDLEREKGEFFKMMTDAHAVLLLSEIYKKEQKVQRQEASFNQRYTLLKRILDVIDSEYQFITFKDVCKRFNYSPAHFSRLFSSFTGTNFTTYLISLKISHAVKLLQTDKQLSVTDIATKCGFLSIRNFNRYFKIMTGYTPTTLPNCFEFSWGAIKKNNVPTDPTSKSSILLD